MSENTTGVAKVKGVLSYNNETRTMQMKKSKWDGDYREIFNDNNRLGEVGDATYLQLMTFNGYANQDRFLKDKYLTPELINVYGSNPQIEGNNGYFNVFNRVGGVYKHESGRIAEIAETKTVSLKLEANTYEKATEQNNGGVYYLNENAKKVYEYEKEYGLEHSKYGIVYYFTERKVFDKKGKEVFDEAGEPLTENISAFGLKKYVDFERNSRESFGTIKNLDDFSYLMKMSVLEGNRYNNKEGFRFSYNEKDTPIEIEEKKGLFNKTNHLFSNHKINTMFSRFCDYDIKQENFDTAKSPVYGHSHGRNLLKLDAKSGDKTNGYNNPYCRTWTHHHQYKNVSDLIKPFSDDSSIEDIQKELLNANLRSKRFMNPIDGGEYLAENTVLNNNGFVNITPSNIADKKVEIKKCMFSIENLAWKDVPKNKNYISNEQIGPNGGRIMWFPPYDLDFQENITVDWDPNSFIGRGEKVYTYKNTDRTGTLSFTLLIDHPSIIDTMQDKVGMGEEQDIEADILRFFAGDRMLKLKDKPQEVEEKQIIPDNEKVVPSTEGSKICFYVFFPNNYSGNKIITTSKNFEKNGPSDNDWYYYLLCGKGTSVSLKETAKWNGYEMGSNGLGVASEDTKIDSFIVKQNECTQWKVIETKGEKDKRYNYNVDFDLRQTLSFTGNCIDSNSYQLNSKLSGNENELKGATNTFAEVISAILVTQNKGAISNSTENSPQSATYEDIKRYSEKCGARSESICQLINLFNSKDFKITDITITGSASKQDIKPKGDCTKSNAEFLSERRKKAVANFLNTTLLKNQDIKCKIGGNAEMQDLKNDKTVNSKEVKSQRYAYVEITYNTSQVMAATDIDQYGYLEYTNEKIDFDIEDEAEQIGVSYELVKRYHERFSVTDKERIKYVCLFAQSTDILDEISIDGTETEIYNLKRSAILAKEKHILTNEYKYTGSLATEKLKSLINEINDLEDKIRQEEEGEIVAEDFMGYEEYQKLYDKIISEYNNILLTKHNQYEDELFEANMAFAEYLDKQELDKQATDINNEIDKEISNELMASFETEFNYLTKDCRYETEADYFSKLRKEDPFTFNHLVDKFKYFTPAFHSISPEGFNARLTFLQQCTRQGHTIEESNIAKNLVFGRMPVCVLRIGDFINTRIIIQNISINYGDGGMQWDLNPEGAGVQPMFAKISMGIVILGGQSLEAPISRLQNAVSFNFYANAGVYDNRADKASYVGDGKSNQNVSYDYIWNPSSE